MLGDVVGARWILIEALDIKFPPKARGIVRYRGLCDPRLGRRGCDSSAAHR
jgi:hypothetical protein